VTERQAIVIALERIEDGDLAGAVDVLLEALEGAPAPRRHACPYCHEAFEWPGLVDAHLERCAFYDAEATRAA
jgi:hypothetical protein